ncbi:MAG: 30S ribosomal protein S5 [Dehalococcoidales bacterium]|nr:30S ribosomal protein S5 [Dehalococcoidales bacterium]
MKELVSKINPEELVLTDKLVYVNRVSKVMKGGKRLSFSALVVTGDGNGYVGVGTGKAKEVPLAINKANANARRNLIKVPMAGSTIPHEIVVKFGATRVLLKPAAPGTGIIAGSSVRVIMESAGVKDILTKSLGSSNRVNMAKATILALTKLRDLKGELAKRRPVARVEDEVVNGG